MRKILFIDRDGTLIVEPQPSQQVDSFDKLTFLPGVISQLGRVAALEDYELVIVTNQDGLGTDSFPEADFWPVHNLMLEILSGEGIRFEQVLIDRSFGHTPAPTRKPQLGLLQDYLAASDIDWANSWVIGDRLTDVQLAQNLGCGHAAWLGSAAEVSDRAENPEQWLESASINPNRPKISTDQVLLVDNWHHLADVLIMGQRKVQTSRHTNETKIDISLNIDGSGQCEIQTGLGFFDHMLEQIGRHGGLDLNIRTQGDLHIDEHHTIEDTAIALGDAIKKALGDKRGINRYGFVLAMDDAQATVAIDFGGRPWLVWEADFRREKVGDMPTEMFSHFFKSFADAAAANVQIAVKGDNEHHKIEAIFKGLAKCIKQAASRDHQRLQQLPSTKGML